jgi:peptidoglycan hydrolase-like protein with peptidoglycan-binding domain
MAKSGLTRIDRLFEGVMATDPIGPGDPDKESVGAIQDLLHGHGQPSLPGLTSPDYGAFGNKTKAAVTAFRAAAGLPPSNLVDIDMMKALIATPAPKAIASRPYVTLALDFAYDGLTKIVLLTSILEGKGAFGAANLNTDKAGMSFGMIQWAQKPKRLHEILQAFHDADADAFTTIFGGSDESVASGLLAHTSKVQGGVDDSGHTTDAKFDLVSAPWTDRFASAARSQPFQKAQVTTAIAAFQKSLATLHGYAPDFTTERAIAFQLDVANQFGDAGAKSLFTATKADGQSVAEHVSAIADESVRRMKPEFQAGTRNRRNLFLQTPLLADSDVDRG